MIFRHASMYSTALALTAALQISNVEAQDTPVTTTLVATHDANVSRFFNFSNFGNDVILDVDGYTKPELVRGLVRFDQAAIAAAVGSNTFMSATLVLTHSAPAECTGTDPTLNTYRLTSAWNESTVTWASIFGFGEPFDTANPTQRTIVPNGATGTVSIDVSKDVAAFLNGTANNGWVLKDDGYANGVHARFVSSESPVTANRPKLVIQVLPAGFNEETPVVPTFGAAGEVIFDGSNGASLIELTDHGKVFANNAAYYNWAVTNLNAKRILDSNGQTVDVEFDVVELGTLTAIHRAREELYDIGDDAEIADVLEAIFGGRSGYMTIGGVAQCVRVNGCDPAMSPMAPPTTEYQCSGSYCIRQHTQITGSGWFKKSGTRLQQKEGGYHVKEYRCWKRLWIFGKCKKGSGSNTLKLQTNWWRNSDESGPGWSKTTQKNDVTEINHYRRGLIGGPRTQITAVCSVGSGWDVSGVYNVYTSKGVDGHHSAQCGSIVW